MPRWTELLLGLALIGMVVIGGVLWMSNPAGGQSATRPAPAGAMACCDPNMMKECGDQLSAAMTAVEAAQKAVAANDIKTAAAELEKARKALAAGQDCFKKCAVPAPATQPAAKIANARCPILGTPIDANTEPESLTRMFKGQKVAFCCDGCPQAWDKLSDAEKEAKLDKAK